VPWRATGRRAPTSSRKTVAWSWAELPGVKKEDIVVEMRDGDLVISGERKTDSEVKEQDYYRIERSYGSFRRRIPMPFDVRPEQVKANYKDGVLEVEIPKPALKEPEAKKITVR
jgi:HSP20 family protein